MATIEKPVIAFRTQKTFETWLKKNHAMHDGFWMQLYKKASGEKSITYAEAVESALCFGWIDGQKKTYDEASWLQGFTPRRKRSGWSLVNVGHIARLTKEGRMHAAGIAQVEAAKADGRWDRAYPSSSTFVMPQDFLDAVAKNKKVKAFYDGLPKASTYAIAYHLITAKKPETRAKRLKDFIAMLKEGRAPHLL